jgi:hypothetical protein
VPTAASQSSGSEFGWRDGLVSRGGWAVQGLSKKAETVVVAESGRAAPRRLVAEIGRTLNAHLVVRGAGIRRDLHLIPRGIFEVDGGFAQ